jgi:futalosine hydrolase
VVNIISEVWGDLGAEDHNDFLDLFDLGILKTGEKPFSGKEMVNPGNPYSGYFAQFPRVKGLTVNKSQGKKESIKQCIQKFNPDVESMEGAAVFSACISRGINFQCLRSISNFVEPRNRSLWDIEGALRNLTFEVNRIISEIR